MRIREISKRRLAMMSAANREYSRLSDVQWRANLTARGLEATFEEHVKDAVATGSRSAVTFVTESALGEAALQRMDAARVLESMGGESNLHLARVHLSKALVHCRRIGDAWRSEDRVPEKVREWEAMGVKVAGMLSALPVPRA